MFFLCGESCVTYGCILIVITEGPFFSHRGVMNHFVRLIIFVLMSVCLVTFYTSADCARHRPNLQRRHNVFTVSRCLGGCPVICHSVPCQHRLIRTASGPGESITHMVPPRHLVTVGVRQSEAIKLVGL